jgi:hypothetical protein
MEPLIGRGSVVVFQGYHGRKTIHPGDIVLFETVSDKIKTVHRVLDHRDGKVVTKGDSRLLADDRISVDQIKGIVVGVLQAKTFVSFSTFKLQFLNNVLFYYSLLEWKHPRFHRFLRGRRVLYRMLLG